MLPNEARCIYGHKLLELLRYLLTKRERKKERKKEREKGVKSEEKHADAQHIGNRQQQTEQGGQEG